jgi:hypothetical protein
MPYLIRDAQGNDTRLDSSLDVRGIHTPSSEIVAAKRMRDVMGRMKMSRGQNVYDADFEYGIQPMRWETLVSGSGSVAHLPGEGGVRMNISTTSGDVTIRQSRPYHRYQPGKSMFMATAVNFGANNVNQVQRVGYFDDNNGIFFEQGANPLDAANPSGMFAVVRSDVSSVLSQGRPTDTKIPAYMWTDPQGILSSINWGRLQMLWLEYAWYGGGALRWGVLIDGEPFILHEIGSGNNSPDATQSSTGGRGGASTTSATSLNVSAARWTANMWQGRTLQVSPNTTVSSASSGAVLPQATINVVSTAGFPASGSVLIQNQVINYTGVTATTLTGCTGGNVTLVTGSSVVSQNPYFARISSNTTDTLTIADIVTGGNSSITSSNSGHNWSILMLPTPGRPWSRTGNLPVRYEQRNIGTALANDMLHYGVSVIVEGGVDDQRGFTYAYGSPWSATSANAGRRQVAASANRIPVVSLRGRTMGTQEYTQASSAITAGTTTTLVATGTPWTVNQWQGRFVNYGTPAAGMLPNIARIVSNTTSTLTIVDPVTGGSVTAPVAGQNYVIGQVNRGQVLPRRLQITSDQAIFVEIVTSTPSSQVNLTGASFVANSASPNSFALIDSSATAYTSPSGEVVYSIFVPANQPVDQQIDNLFPLLNSIRGNATDMLTALVTNTTASTANVSIQIIGQEAMS